MSFAKASWRLLKGLSNVGLKWLMMYDGEGQLKRGKATKPELASLNRCWAE
jgi:hypothetical protein